MKQPNKKLLLPIGIIVITFSLLIAFFLFNRENIVDYDKDGIRVIYKGIKFPIHSGGHRSLYYGKKKLCSHIEAISPHFFLLSPDKRYLLYINREIAMAESISWYEVYKISDSRKTLFPQLTFREIVSINDDVHWLTNGIIIRDEYNEVTLDFLTGKQNVKRVNKSHNKVEK